MRGWGGGREGEGLFRLCDWETLQQNLVLASTSFSGMLSNSKRISNSANWLPLRMTFTSDLDLTVLLHFELSFRTCLAKHLHILTEASFGYGHSPDGKLSLAVDTDYIFGYIMFCAIS